MTKQLHLNENNFTPQEQRLIEWLAARRRLAGIVEYGLKAALKNEALPIIADAKAQIQSEVKA